ncbi:hypothetical protein VI817_005470 [Penicillium citrinum]|nr:hypothetical protein VI817_005470 [Penicillium citrinum]
MDLETQDHILNYQLPVAITRYNVGLVVIDSITSNYRAEHNSNNMLALSARSTELAKLGQMLRNLAAKEEIAIVLANQVSDRFESESNNSGPTPRSGYPSMLSQSTAIAMRESGIASPLSRGRMNAPDQPFSSTQGPSSSPISSSPYHAPDDERFDGSYLIENPARNDILSLQHQERFFTGWGDGFYSDPSPKTPALGFFWSTQIACRIALKKETHSVVAPWNDTYPLSTPQEQTGSQFQSAATNLQASNITEGPLVDAGKEEAVSTSEGDNDQKKSQDEPGNSKAPQRPLPNPPEYITRRTLKLVFSPWNASRGDPNDAKGTESHNKNHSEIEIEIWKGGLRSVGPEG